MARESGMSVLWWGRSDVEYSRNRIVRQLFQNLGWLVDFFHPVASSTGLIEAYIRRTKRPDLVWVPCFRQRDISSATYWARKWRVPLVADPLISAYEKEIFEKEKWSPDSAMAERLRRWESKLLEHTDRIVTDTGAHADFFSDSLGIRKDKLSVLYVGAESEYFRPVPWPAIEPPYEILFYGSFLQLQGVDIVIEAARLTRELPIRWVLLGDGPLRSRAQEGAAGLENVGFEPWIDYVRLPERIAKAHILLGIFGVTPKANLVIPNKVFQAMAVGRPLITRKAAAYNDNIGKSDVIGWIPEGSPAALAECVKSWLDTPAQLASRGRKTWELFDEFFGVEKRQNMLAQILEKTLSRQGLPAGSRMSDGR